MSEELKEVDYDSINEGTFKDIKYQDLLVKFKELGVESAWKPGSKAKDMVKDALEKIAVLKELKSKGVEGDEAKDKADKIIGVKNALDNIDEESDSENKVLENLDDKSSEKARIVAMNLTKPQLEDVAANIKSNLKNNVPTHRLILLKKLEIVEEIISEYED